MVKIVVFRQARSVPFFSSSHSPPHPFQKNNPHSPHYQNETTVKPKK
jgi:hypothetical protein